MTTPEELTTALNDFITECSRNHYICKKCRYHSVCDRLIVWESNAPCDWELYPKEESQ